MKWWMIALIILVVILFSPLFIFIPGTFILLLFICLLTFFLYLFNKKRKFLYLLPFFMVLLLILYSSITIHAPIETKVIDAVTQELIQDIQLVRSVRGTTVVFNPGGQEDHRLKKQTGFSSSKGEYNFGWIYSLNIPFFIIFDSDQVTFGDSRFYSDETSFNTSLYSNLYFAHVLNSEEIIGTLEERTIFPAKSSTKRISFIPKKTTLYLFPFVDEFEDCNPISSDFLRSICIEANIDSVAQKKNDINICLENRVSYFLRNCVWELAIYNNNLLACDLLGNEVNACKRTIATQTHNQSLCELIPNSFWEFRSPQHINNQEFQSESWRCSPLDISNY